HCTIGEKERKKARKRYVSSKKSGRDGQDPATCVLFRECHLPLPWTSFCGPPLLQCLSAWGGMVAHRQRSRGLRAVATTLAPLRHIILGTTTHPARARHRACSDECLLLSRDLPR